MMSWWVHGHLQAGKLCQWWFWADGLRDEGPGLLRICITVLLLLKSVFSQWQSQWWEQISLYFGHAITRISLADGPHRHFGTWAAGRPVRTRLAFGILWLGTVAAWSLLRQSTESAQFLVQEARNWVVQASGAAFSCGRWPMLTRKSKSSRSRGRSGFLGYPRSQRKHGLAFLVLLGWS